MEPVNRESYEAYFTALAMPLTGDLAKKMERIRQDLLSHPDDGLVEAYRNRIPEMCTVLEEHSLKFSGLYDPPPGAPEGLEVFAQVGKKEEDGERALFSLSEAFEVCLQNKDFDLALAINQQERTKVRELHFREFIKAQFSFDETTESVPEEFKRLYQMIEKDRYLLMWETIYPEGVDAPILQNPKILRELAAFCEHKALKELMLAKAGEMEYSSWCLLS